MSLATGCAKSKVTVPGGFPQWLLPGVVAVPSGLQLSSPITSIPVAGGS